MAGNDAVDFSLIEGHKENIQPLASGRSARALASVLTPTTASTPQNTRIVASAARAAFEKELTTASELDDPLEVWERYFRWTLDNFPSGQSAESGIVQLLERVTKEFLREPQYKNDPRYLKMWVHYIQNYSDAPREHFAYLARHDIGQRLALFYEEFASYLESIDRRNQAGEIYRSGIENNARPVDRLVRKYEEFMQRLEANPIRDDEPSSPAIPSVRPALASKSVPFGVTAGSPDPQASQGIPSASTKKPAKKKLAVFSDADSEPAPKDKSAAGPVGWESIGTREHRKKENTQEPRPWAGETLKQAGKSTKKEKLSIFRDTVRDNLFPQLQLLILIFVVHRTNSSGRILFWLSLYFSLVLQPSNPIQKNAMSVLLLISSLSILIQVTQMKSTLSKSCGQCQEAYMVLTGEDYGRMRRRGGPDRSLGNNDSLCLWGTVTHLSRSK